MNLFIISADDGTNSLLAKYRHELLAKAVYRLGLHARDVRGRFNGIEEDSLLVPVTGSYADYKEKFLTLAACFNQQYIMFIDGDQAMLIEVCSGMIEHMGEWTELAPSAEGTVSGSVYVVEGDYTMDTCTGKIYVVTPKEQC